MIHYYAAPGVKISNISDERGSMTIVAGQIIEKVCLHLGVPERQFYSKLRTDKVCMARSISVWFITQRTTLPLMAIGRILGRDHTSIITAREKVKGQLSLKFENDYKTAVKTLQSIL